MDASQFDFDALAKHLSVSGTRRRLVGALAAVPLVGGLLDILSPDEAAAHGRRQRRKKRHKHGKGRRRKRKAKKRCTPEAASQTCAGRCGSVTNTCKQAVDCGPCPCTTGLNPTDDLRAAIHDAPDGATLTLCAGTWNLADTLDISRPITLLGAGAGQTILDGQDQQRVLQIAADVPVTVQALTITRGKNDFGGAGIYNAGDLTLIDAVVSDNHSSSQSDGGGGIYTFRSLTVRNSRITGNTSSDARGGGILNNLGVVTLESGSLVEANTAFNGGGVNNAGGTLTLKRGSTIAGNTARGWGGGIHNDVGTVELEDGSRVADNTAEFGGGIFHSAGQPATGTVTLRAGSRLEANTATDDDGGGAIFNFVGSGTVTAEAGALICENSAPQCDGFAITGVCPNPAGACPA